MVQQFAFLRAVAMVAFAGLGDGIEEAPRGMALVQEHAPILHRDLDVGHQHPADLAAHVGLEIALVEQHVEQHADQVDGVFLHVRQVEVVAAHAEPARTRQDFARSRSASDTPLVASAWSSARGGSLCSSDSADMIAAARAVRAAASLARFAGRGAMCRCRQDCSMPIRLENSAWSLAGTSAVARAASAIGSLLAAGASGGTASWTTGVDRQQARQDRRLRRGAR